MSSFARLATVTASTKRVPQIAGGKRGAAAVHLASLACTPLDPVSAETAQRFGLDTPHTVRECFVDGAADVVKGDVLVVDGKDYPIRALEPWSWRAARYLRLIVEVLER